MPVVYVGVRKRKKFGPKTQTPKTKKQRKAQSPKRNYKSPRIQKRNVEKFISK